MPKILINEQDFTTPGTPGNYANFAVLITGFAGEVSDPIVKPDNNNAYEFKSAQTFKDTIGLVAPSMTKSTSDGGFITIKHYGNQMAYELLKLGYPIIYKSLGNLDEDYTSAKEVIDTITSENLWEPFKDKASYDFRFVTHGLLASTADSLDDNEEYQAAVTRKIVLEEAEGVLNEIEAKADEAEAKAEQEGNTSFEREDFIQPLYTEALGLGYTGLLDSKGEGYTDFEAAKVAVAAALDTVNATMEKLTYTGLSAGHINTVNGNIANLAKYVAVDNPTNKTVVGRGDCIALIELDERKYTVAREDVTKPEELIILGINEMSEINAENGRYCALTVPSVTYKMSESTDFGGNKLFPGAFHYLACFLNSVRLGFAEWYAAAGYTRGVSSFVVDHATVKLGEIAINALEPRNIIDSSDPKFACNVIANFRGSYYLWGNRTAHPLGKKGSLDTGDLVASSFLNIRQLCTTIKKQLYVACRTFTFDPNSDALWVNFVNAIRPTLENMKADQGIRDYKILKVFTDTKATLKAKIRLIPIEAVEDFDLEVSLEDSFGETAAVVTE